MPIFSHRVGAFALACLALPAVLVAQEPESADTTPADTGLKKPVQLESLTVTTTKTGEDIFHTATPVAVLEGQTYIKTAANGVPDPFRDMPALDVNGVGPNQLRPTIRGQSGQRILLLEDGIRLNNSRRQVDFGELPSIVNLDGIDRVEVVRGPASVLYGTDAIGGVVNLITTKPSYFGQGSEVNGALGFRYSVTDDQVRPVGQVFGRSGRVGFGFEAAYRNAVAYEAPGGSFGNITFPGNTLVNDTGVQDENYSAQVGFGLSKSQDVYARYERYQANNAGFGYVDNAALGLTNAPTIQITYPTQTVNKVTAGYQNNGIHSVIADRIDVQGYYQSNDRLLDLNIIIPTGPGAQGVINQKTFTTLDTWGLRVEATKVIAGKQVLTYGGDYFHDHSQDDDTLTVTGFGPPQTSTVPNVPNAVFQSAGLFAQGDLSLVRRLSLVVGGRVQAVNAQTLSTPSITTPLENNTTWTGVGALNVGYQVIDELNLVASVASGFRAANLVERYFTGPSPEGGSYQIGNPALKPENSLNVDLGAKYQRGRIYAEVFVFQNNIYDGIRFGFNGDTVQGLPVITSFNVAKLRYEGVEVLATVGFWKGFQIGGNYSYLNQADVNNPNNPIGETYSSKLVGTLGYTQPHGLFWASYSVRHNFEQKDVIVTPIPPPVGPVLPAFTVMSIQGGVRLFTVGRVTNNLDLAVMNLTNVLYAEFGNTSFFRPESKRNFAVTWRTVF